MKLIISYFKLTLLSIFLLLSNRYDIFSQEAEITTVVKPGMYIGVSFGPSQSHIVNNGTLSVSEMYSHKNNSSFGSIEIGYFFSDYFGLSSGIGLNSCKTQLTLNDYENKFSVIDSENEVYERRVSASGITEEQKVSLLSVPVFINIRIPFTRTAGFFLQPGVSLSVPINTSYQSSGVFTYKGYYPAYNVLLEDLPDYGFPSDYNSESSGQLEIKPLSFNAVVSAGFDVIIKHKFQIALAVFYDQSLKTISNYSSPGTFQLSTDVSQINSLMGGSSKTTTQSIGLKLVLRFYLKKRKVEKLQEINRLQVIR